MTYTTDKKTKFTPDELKECCLTAIEQWDFNPEDHVDDWGDKSEEYIENYKLVLQQMIDNPYDFMDEEEDGECLNLENHKKGFSHSSLYIWDYLTDRCEGYAAVWTNA